MNVYDKTISLDTFNAQYCLCWTFKYSFSSFSGWLYEVLHFALFCVFSYLLFNTYTKKVNSARRNLKIPTFQCFQIQVVVRAEAISHRSAYYSHRNLDDFSFRSQWILIQKGKKNSYLQYQRNITFKSLGIIPLNLVFNWNKWIEKLSLYLIFSIIL